MLTSYTALIGHYQEYGANGPTLLKNTASHQSKHSGSMARKSNLRRAAGIANQVKQSCYISTAEATYAEQPQKRT